MVLKIGTFGDDLLNGTYQSDTLQGSFGDDLLRGYAGNDILFGGPGDDELEGNQGNDLLHFGPGVDILNGGGGSDTVKFDTDEDVTFDDEDNLAVAANGSATLYYIENADTGGGNDFVKFSTVGVENNIATTHAGNDVVFLGAGNDVANLGSGNDRAVGADGNDTLNGGSGDDRLYGGVGVDHLAGGSGADDFEFFDGDSGVGAGDRDEIVDFQQGIDDIHLSEFGGLDFMGSDAFTAPDQVRFVHSGGNTIISINTIGNSGAEMQIELAGVVNLIAGDFIL